MNRRSLDLRDYDSVIKDLDNLHARGYDKAGNWNLAEVSEHLTMSLESALTPYGLKAPWLVRTFVAPIFYRRIMKRRQMPAGIKGPPKLMPKGGGNEVMAMRHCQEMLKRVRDHQGEYQPHAFFGKLTPEQTRDFHLIHCSHHLSFLVPK